jgi:hypothetical protein
MRRCPSKADIKGEFGIKKVDVGVKKIIRFLSSSSSSYIATNGQSASSSWCRAPFGAADQMLHLFE